MLNQLANVGIDTAVVDAEPAGSRFVVPLGITQGLSNDHYHGDTSACSSTKLKAALISGEHYLLGLQEPETKESLLFGSAMHCYLLEPDLFPTLYYVASKVDGRTKNGKETKERESAMHRGKECISEGWIATFERIKANIARHTEAASALEGAEREVTLSWIDEPTGLKLKIKADAWNRRLGQIMDLKSAEYESKYDFARACARHNYALSSAMYSEGVYRVTGEKHAWSFIACGKDAPHSVAMYRPDESFMRRGHRDFRRALENVARWKESGYYPPLQDGRSETISLPSWY